MAKTESIARKIDIVQLVHFGALRPSEIRGDTVDVHNKFKSDTNSLRGKLYVSTIASDPRQSNNRQRAVILPRTQTVAKVDTH